MAGTDKLTAGILLTIAGLHVAWARGSPFPLADREQLADAVVGRPTVPSPAACYAVAGAIAVSGALVADVPHLPPAIRRPGLIGVAGILGLRGALGLAGRTDLVSAGSTSARFGRLDRRFYSPLCLALALGALGGLRGS